MSIFAKLEELACEIELVDFVKTVKIGIEPNISPEDYPLVRIVPQRMSAEAPYNKRLVETGIFFGANVTAAEGMERVYDELFFLEEEIIKAVKRIGGKYFETITDEDRLDTYKMMFIRADLFVDRPEQADA
jgi:hypothetical protein